MSYIGRGLQSGAFRQLDSIASSFNGSTTGFTMQVNSTNVIMGDANQILLSLGGVIQNPGTDFTISSSTLTFTTAPAANTSFFAILIGSDNGGTLTPTDLSVTTAKIVDANDTTAKITDANITKAKLADSIDIFAGTSLSAADLGSGIHIKSADASASTHTSVDELVLENSGHCGLHIISGNASTGNIYWGDDGGTARGYFQYNHDGDEIAIGTGGSTAITFASTGTAKITSTGIASGATGDGDFPAFGLGIVNSHADNANGIYYKNTGGAPDSTALYMILCQDSSTNRFLVNAQGDAQNHDNSFGAISDERIKSNIADANSQWNDIKALKVRNFERKDDITQYGSGKKIQIGVVAQEVAAVSPGLVREAEPTAEDIKMSSEFGTLNEDGTIKTTTGEKVKSVSYSVLYMKAIKALQEAMARIEALEAK